MPWKNGRSLLTRGVNLWGRRRLQHVELPKLVFMHLPKCGGTSVHTALTEIYDKTLVNPERHNGLYSDVAAVKPHHTLYSGHFDFASTETLRREFSLVSIFRNPRARLVSMYNFLRAHQIGYEHSPVFRLHYLSHAHDIEDFFALKEVRAHPAIMNGLTRSLSNTPLPFYRWEDASRVSDDDDITARLYEAKQNLLAFRFIGQLSNVRKFLEALEFHLDLPKLPERNEQSLNTIMNKRAGMRVIKPQKLLEKDSDVLNALVTQDEELYSYASQLFEW